MELIQSFFVKLPYFIVLIGLLIFVHEGGHFIFAKLFKVKVHVFSLGFGPKLFGFRKGETLYKVSLVPIGGYVKMLGEDPSERVEEGDRGRAFGDQPVWQRMCIILGGPAMNLIFPLFLYFGIGLGTTQVMPPEVGSILPETPAAQIGLQPGDIILAVNGEPVESFSHLISKVAPHPGKKLQLTVIRQSETLEFDLVPKAHKTSVIPNYTETVGQIGISAAYANTLIGIADPQSPAYQAGLRTFDLIVSIDGEPVERRLELEEQLVAAAGKTVTLEVKKLKTDIKPPFHPFEEQLNPTVHRISLAVPAHTQSLAALGIENSSEFILYVSKDGAAEKIGLQRGDRLLGLDGKSMSMVQIYASVDQQPDVTRTIAWTRQGVRQQASYLPKFIPAGEAADLGVKRDVYDKGFWALRHGVVPELIDNPALFASALRTSLAQTYSGFKLTWIGFKLLIQGKISMRALGGPIMIGQLAGQAAEQGAGTFFWIMALISINLGLINLFPIPVLDGGQMVFLFVEGITRRPINRIIKERVMLIGVAMILLIMVYATWNDIARLVVG